MSEEFEDQDNTAHSLVLQKPARPERIYLMPVYERPFMPGLVQPVLFDESIWEGTAERVSQTPHRNLGLVYVERNDGETLTPDNTPEYGCLARVHHVSQEGDSLQLVVQGLTRFRIRRWLSEKAPYLVEVEYPEEETEEDLEVETVRAYALAIINTIKELLPLNPLYNEGLKAYLQNFSPREPSPLTDFAAALTTANPEELQGILETVPLLNRMEKTLVLLKKELEVAQLQSQITEQVNEQISSEQRRFFLREQLKVIQQELGIAKDDRTSDLERFEERMAKLDPPEAVQQRFEDEMGKLAMLESGSSEYSVTRNYLDWLTQVPWGVVSPDNLDLQHARKVLEKHHAGLTDVKDRIIEFLAVGTMRGEIRGSIVLLVGPPGVGKTSIGKSIAESLNRPFYRFSVGGMRDEAEIKGHRRTYIGALPGKLVQALKETGTSNPVVMLDEIDKMGASYQGDPASALLEVLDPEQNVEFQDHYLDVRLDLSKALFICTANTLDSIPPALLDRMEIIRLAGYITDEKVEIARKHLWPRTLKRAGVKAAQLRISPAALKLVVENYARESGVRGLEKQLQRIVRKAVVRLLEGEEKISVTGKNLTEFLGQPIFRTEAVQDHVGVVTGLAWTSMGGATLPVEAQLVHQNKGGFQLTGQLGDVMKESAGIAYSYVQSASEQFKLPKDWFKNAAVHLHVPEGATPKDGPSAGVTMATALISLVKQQKLKRKVAMTGELTLTGQVLAVGGIREKIVAARRVGIFELILPKDNERDYDELPDYLKEKLTVHFASHYRDVYKLLF